MAFSSALVLTDLNDYIAPSQACIKPVEIQKSEDKGPTEIRVDQGGDYYEISQDGGESKLEKASITLNDCLACSGCVTSAESVLITMQSQEELYNVLNTNKLAITENDPGKRRTIVISISPQSRASLAAKYNLSPLQTHKRLVYFFKHHLGAHHVFDTSFSRDLSLVESAREFVERYRNYMANGGEKIEAAMMQQDQAAEQEQETGGRRRARVRRKVDNSDAGATQQHIPMLASACPGWVCYAEKTHGTVLPHIATAKSPQQMMGSLVKDYIATKTGTTPSAVYHVSVMPCYDKKLEASRPDFFLEQFNTREVDCVLTTGEVEKMFSEQNVNFLDLPEAPIDDMFNKANNENVYGSSGTSSGGYLEYIMATAARELFGITDVPEDPASTPNGKVVMKMGKNADVCEYFLQVDDGRILLRFATAFGFRNIQNIVRKIKSGKCPYHYVEVMACPGGCVNGGGQLPNPNAEEVMSAKEWVSHVEKVYQSVSGVPPDQNEVLKSIYEEWIGDPQSEKAHKLLRTQYHAVTQSFANPLATKW